MRPLVVFENARSCGLEPEITEVVIHINQYLIWG